MFGKRAKMSKSSGPHVGRPTMGGAHASGGSHIAFGAGGNRAFRDPTTMAAPDQAFSAAMAQPQSGPASPMPPMPPTEG